MRNLFKFVTYLYILYSIRDIQSNYIFKFTVKLEYRHVSHNATAEYNYFNKSIRFMDLWTHYSILYTHTTKP